MNVYENMRNKRKMVLKIRRVCTPLSNCQLLTFLDYQTCNQIKVETLHLICIFININENIRNKRKMLETLKGCKYNITHMSAANYFKLPNLVPNEQGVIVF